MKSQPLVSIIMPVYNSEKYLKSAIDSILSQTYTNFEFLIFNDGSVDKSDEIIKNFKDSRIRYFSYNKNQGYVVHLNKGIELSEGKYLARMDADDLSLSERIQAQVEFLELNDQISLCGTWYKYFGEEDKVITPPISSSEIKVELINRTVFSHPTVMIRKSVLRQYNLKYENDLLPAEDYKLWTSLAKVSETYNLPTVLLEYRVHQGQISKYKKELQREKMYAIREDYLTSSFPSINRKNISALNYLFNQPSKITFEDFFKIKNLFDEIEKINKSCRSMDECYLKQFIYKYWLYLHNISTRHGLKIFYSFISSEFCRYKKQNYLDLTRLFLKCLFRKSNSLYSF